MIDRPKIDDAPGLVWKRRKNGWEARWQARTDLVKRDFPIKSQGLKLWTGGELDAADIIFIQERCQALQGEMLIWGRGGIPVVQAFDGTVSSLIECYRTDEDSSYLRNCRFATRQYYDKLCTGIRNTPWKDDEGNERTLGTTNVSEIKARLILRWHKTWAVDGKIPMAHALIGMLRTLCSFGTTILENEHCSRVSGVLGEMRFPMSKPREQTLSAEQVLLVRAKAYANGHRSIALAQAIQFDCTLRQKDVIGEWVPTGEPGPLTDTLNGNKKWLRGVRWEEIDEALILTHITSKRQKEIQIDLKEAPMVLDELDRQFPGWNKDRSKLPATGPIIVRESTEMPWDANEFRKHWRIIANECGIPKNVRNMDSRAGAITEALGAGANIDQVRKGATHSTQQMTARYSRDILDATTSVMKVRAASRLNKTGR